MRSTKVSASAFLDMNLKASSYITNKKVTFYMHNFKYTQIKKKKNLNITIIHILTLSRFSHLGFLCPSVLSFSPTYLPFPSF